MNEAVNYNYLDLLNDQQRSAVIYKDGPSLVIAGAGSGKTRVLTYKIVDLLRNGFEPYRILALTFTNKAAREMQERIRGIVGERIASRLWMGTFHSIFLRILRRHGDLIGFKSNFTIYDSTDSKSLIKMIIKDLGVDEKIYKPGLIANKISNAKNALQNAAIYNSDADNLLNDKRAKVPMTGRIFAMYEDRCRISGAMDFDDILYYMNVLLRDNPDILRHYQDFFRYILVDEYQDTNFAQHLIISQLAGERQRLCVVGDDAQSIYSFRGANIGNILNMEQNFPDLKIFKLERNYRSTQNIINAAGSLIAKNTRQMPKNVYSENEKGEPVTIMSTYSDIEEAYLIANMITQTKYTAHDSYDEYAILYRTNAQSRVLEESLRKRNIPYRIYGGLSFYQRKEIKDAICYFRMSINPDDDEALRRIINYPARGIGETTLKKLQSTANISNTSIWNVICNPDKYNPGVNKGTLKKLSDFRSIIQEFINAVNNGASAWEVGQLVFNRSGLLTCLAHDNTPESISRSENLSELLSGLKYFVESRTEAGEEDVSMTAFLNEVSLSTDQDEQEDHNEPKVTLMTAHASKGLEFKHIYIVGVEEELFPSAMSMNSMLEVEEERRLLYVAMTRAKSTCVMTYSSSRYRNGQTVLTRPSRFLSDIDTRYVKMRTSSDIGTNGRYIDPLKKYHSTSETYYGSQSYQKQKTNPVDLTSANGIKNNSTVGKNKIKLQNFSNSAGSDVVKMQTTTDGMLRNGSKVMHNIFGKGTIQSIENVSGNEVLIVDFEVVGKKKLLRKFAKLTIISQ